MARKKIFAFGIVLFLVVFSVFSFAYLYSQQSSGNNPESFQHIKPEDVSRHPNDVTVRFPAMLVWGPDCVELFSPEDYELYKGDSKYAISSRLAHRPNYIRMLFGSGRVVVTGKMTSLRDVSDTTATCGITGQIFDITHIEYD